MVLKISQETEKTCKNCEWCNGSLSGEHFCKRYPPIVIAVPSSPIQAKLSIQQPGIAFVSIFPQVRIEQSCGEWSEKEDIRDQA